MAGPVATVWAQFRLDMSDFASKLNTASATMRNFANIQQRTLKQQNQGYDSANAMIKSFNRSLSDTINITRGIVISQAFYAAIGAINDATSALWEFNKQLDYAKVTYSALFGDVNLANDFMSVLQEHAINTIFNYQDLAGISKKLLAYGIDYKNLMFIMEGLTNLGTMSGDSAALDRIALALGQIYTKGKLSAEEMRQLANAYVPITEIIQEKFNLSEEDLGRVGDLNLPAEEVINAIVDYANENFGSVGDAAMYTITGLEAKIVDTLKTVGTEMLKPLTTAYKSFLVYISKGLENIREAYAAGGIGGVFEYLVPDERVQKNIRIFLANIKNLFMAVMSLGKAAGQVFGNFAQVFVAVFNLVIPPVTSLVNGLAILINAMASTRAGAALLRVALVAVAGAFVLMRVQAIGALVITAVTKAVTALSKALVVLATVISKHPILSLLAMLGVALLGISVSSNSANSSLSGFFDTLASAGGSSSGDMLQKTEQDINGANDALNQFNHRLEDAIGGADELEDGINGAGNAAKKTSGLLSFDEVFKLPENTDASSGAGSGIGGGIADDIEGIIGGLGTLGDALIPDIPDFSDFFGDFNDSLLGGLSDGLMEKISAGGWGAAIGGILGALIGLAFGNPILGAKIGMAAGSLIGMLIHELEGTVNNMGTGIFAGIWAAIGKSLSKVGAAGLGSIIKNAFAQGGIKAVFTSLGSVLKNAGAKALSKGGIIGMVIGLFVDGLLHLLWNTMEEKFAGANSETAKTGQTIGGLVGTAIGAIFGPIGMVVGSLIGSLVGGLLGLFWEPIKQWFTDVSNSLYNWFHDTMSDLSTWWHDTKVGFGTWVSDTWTDVTTWTRDTAAEIGAWVSNTYVDFENWCADTSREIQAWRDETWNKFTTWCSDTARAIGTWCADTWNDFTTWCSNTARAIGTWASDTWNKFTTWCSNTARAIGTWASDTWSDITTWCSNTARAIGTWSSDTWNKFTTWCSNTARAIGTWASDTWSDINTWSANAIKSIGSWLANTWNKMSTWFTNTKADVRTWWNGLFDVSGWKSGWDNVKSWFSNLFSDIGSWFRDIGKSVSGWWDGLWDGKSVNVSASGRSGISLGGHAAGGIFDREHIARFAEGNKAEMIVPLENARAMQPFVDAISGGIVSSLAPIMATVGGGNSNSLPPMYVGTLIADERGLRELYKKFEVIQVQENARRGTVREVF